MHSMNARSVLTYLKLILCIRLNFNFTPSIPQKTLTRIPKSLKIPVPDAIWFHKPCPQKGTQERGYDTHPWMLRTSTTTWTSLLTHLNFTSLTSSSIQEKWFVQIRCLDNKWMWVLQTDRHHRPPTQWSYAVQSATFSSSLVVIIVSPQTIASITCYLFWCLCLDRRSQPVLHNLKHIWFHCVYPLILFLNVHVVAHDISSKICVKQIFREK